MNKCTHLIRITITC